MKQEKPLQGNKKARRLHKMTTTLGSTGTAEFGSMIANIGGGTMVLDPVKP